MKLHEILSEVYSRNTNFIKTYLKDKPLDFSEYCYQFVYWLQNEFEEYQLEDIADKHNISLDELLDDSDIYESSVHQMIFNELMKNPEYKELFISYIGANEIDAPMYSAMELNREKLLPRQTWLVHFTNDAESIGHEGFKYGFEDVRGLHLTTHHYDRKKYPGYNFAFIANSKDARNAEREHKYGRQFVLFQNSGVSTYHYGDEEEQIIFYGPDVNPRDIVTVVQGHDTDYAVINKNTHQEIFKSDNYIDIINWVAKNFAQYRKALTGF